MTESKDGLFELPGFKSTFCMENPIIPKGHLSWAEMLHYSNQEYRRPPTKQVVENILKTAYAFEDIRERLGNRPLIVTSGFRDIETNYRVGGAKNSLHTQGLAIDFYPIHMNVNKAWGILNPMWNGGLGRYSTFIHFDCGLRRRWG